MEEDKQIEDSESKKSIIFFLKIIGSIVLIFLIIFMIIPSYSVKLDPEPKNHPGLEIIPKIINPTNRTIQINTREDFLKFLEPNNNYVKETADKIVQQACDSSKICQAKAIFYFVRDNFNYVSDPNSYEYVKTAEQSLNVKVGDCDDAAVLLANLLQSIGIETQFVFIPGHVFLQIKLDEALWKYKDNGWINLDPTCKNCDFGQIPFKTSKLNKTYI